MAESIPECSDERRRPVTDLGSLTNSGDCSYGNP
jgi:hypothetical protein